MDSVGQRVQLFSQPGQAHAFLRSVEAGGTLDCRRIRPVPDLAGNDLCKCEESGLDILKDRGEETIVVFSAKGTGGNSVYPDISAGREIESAEQLYQGSLARSV